MFGFMAELLKYGTLTEIYECGALYHKSHSLNKQHSADRRLGNINNRNKMIFKVGQTVQPTLKRKSSKINRGRHQLGNHAIFNCEALNKWAAQNRVNMLTI